MKEAVIVSISRTAVGKAPRGTLRNTRPDDMAAAAIAEALRRVPGLEPAEVEDVILGCAMPEAQQGNNVARIASLRAGLPVTCSAMTINRFCSSGLQSIAHAAYQVMAGQAQVIVAGGSESMSMVPMIGNKFAPDPYFALEAPEVFTNMGLTAENVAEKYGVSRQDQDEFALRSNQRATAAVQSGLFDPELVPVEVEIIEPGADGKTRKRSFTFCRDEGPRADTSLEALAKLKPVFKEGGTVTAGNASQMSDGAAGVLVTSRGKAEELGLKPLARFVSFAIKGVPPHIMGIGPIEAIPVALAHAGLKLDQMDWIELNEAFAAQSLACIDAWKIDPATVNAQGGAIAIGHPHATTLAALGRFLPQLERDGIELVPASELVRLPETARLSPPAAHRQIEPDTH